MPIKTLPEDQLVTMSQFVVKDVAKALTFPIMSMISHMTQILTLSTQQPS